MRSNGCADGGDEIDACSLFREKRVWRELTPDLVNSYIGDVTGIDATAKDFRTWHATVLAAASLARSGEYKAKTDRDAAVRAAMDEAASMLGNTPAQARASYVDPRVVVGYTTHRTVDAGIARRAFDNRAAEQRPLERAVLKLLREIQEDGA